MENQITQIYEQFRKPLLYFIYKNIKDKSVAEDLLHEIFIKAYKNIDTIKEKEKIKSWLYSIAKNTIIDYSRKKKPLNIENEDLLFEEETKQNLYTEFSCCLENVIKTLPAEQQKVFNAVYFKEQSLIEYSELNNINLSTVKSHLKRGKDKLKKVFDECCIFQKNHLNEIVDYKLKNCKDFCN